MRVVLLGGGGHASDVLGAIEALNSLAPTGSPIHVVGILADSEIEPKRFIGRHVRQLGSINDIAHVDATHYIACVGYSAGRRAVAARAELSGLIPLSVTHPRAWVPPGTPVGGGSVILAGVCISPGVTIGSPRLHLSWRLDRSRLRHSRLRERDAGRLNQW